MGSLNFAIIGFQTNVSKHLIQSNLATFGVTSQYRTVTLLYAFIKLRFILRMNWEKTLDLPIHMFMKKRTIKFILFKMETSRKDKGIISDARHLTI